MRKKAHVLVMGAVILSVILLLHKADDIRSITSGRYLPGRQPNPLQDPSSEMLIVLFWNNIHDSPVDRSLATPDIWYFGRAGSKKCPMKNKIAKCFFTTDKSKITKASAVVVSGQHGNHLESTPLPKFRGPKQIYIFYSLEAPAHKRKTKEEYGGWLSAFNWTATYRKDSDVPMPYGRVETLPTVCNSSDDWNDMDVAILSRKNSSVAAIISNCNDRYPRTKLIQELQEAGLKVDVYGKCGNKEHHGIFCPSWGHDCYALLARYYRFFLAFENSVCDDYVTEKLFKALQHPWIPIVYGGANYSDIAPPYSVIQATSSGKQTGVDDDGLGNSVYMGDDQYNKKLKPREVVELVEKLEQNQTLYLSYFRWKRKYKVVPTTIDGCTLCREIAQWTMHSSGNESNIDKMLASKTYADIHDWWEYSSECA